MTITFTEPNQQDRWENRYAKGATGWDRGESSPALDRWLPQMPVPPARVLIPACGRGYEVITLCQQGFTVTAVDFAPSAIAALNLELKKRQLQATVVQSDLLAWEPPQPFDVIYEQTALCALEPTLWPEYADRLCNWLVPGGMLLGLFIQTNRAGGPPWHCALDSLETLFGSDKWVWPEQKDQTIGHPSGLKELALVLKRRD